MSVQLDRMRRVGDIRVRRAERARHEANLAERRCADQLAESEQERAQEAKRQEAAQAQFQANPADPQAQLWRQVTAMRLDQASQARAAAADRLEDAAHHSLIARRAHDSSLERADLIEKECRKARLRQNYLREIRAEGES